MILSFIFLFLSFITTDLDSGTDPVKNSPEPIKEKIEEILNRWDSDNLPGFSIAVVKNGEVILNKGYGMANLEYNIPFTKNSVSLIGSVSKQFIATSILLLEQKRKLNSHDPIGDYFPQLPSYVADVTLYQLMHHTSGISDYVNLIYLSGLDPFEDSIPVDKVWNLICAQKELMFEPGSDYQYSNSNYFLLAQVIEKISGMSLNEFSQEHIFGPLGMDHTTYYDDKRMLIPNRALGYTSYADGSFGNAFSNQDVIGGGGIYTTTDDLIKWEENFYHNQLGNGSPKLIEKLQEKGKLSDGSEIRYAGGLFIGSYKGTKSVSHTGLEGAYRARFDIYPEKKVSIIVLYNSTIINPDISAIRDGVLFDEWPERTEESNSISNELLTVNSVSAKESWNNYTGRYNSSMRAGVFIKIKKVENYLTATRPAGSEPLLEQKKGKFKGVYSNLSYIFQENKNGIMELKQHFSGMDMPPVQKSPSTTQNLAELNEYEGKFRNQSITVPYTIKVGSGEAIIVSLDNLSFSTLYRRKKDVFAGDGIEILFTRNNVEEITGFELQNHRITTLHFEKIR